MKRVLYLPSTLAQVADTSRSLFGTPAFVRHTAPPEVRCLPLTRENETLQDCDGNPRILDRCRRLATTVDSDFDLIVGEGFGGILWSLLLRGMGWTAPYLGFLFTNPITEGEVLTCRLFARTTGQADRIFTGSPAAARVLRALGIEPRIGHPYGIDTEAFRPSAEPAASLRESLGLDPRSLLFVYAGRIGHDKNIPALLELFERVPSSNTPSVQLAMALSNPCSPIARRDRTRAACDGVRFFEDLDRRDLRRLYAAADFTITLSTSPFETFPRMPQEGLACGAIAVLPDWGPFRDVVPRAVGRWIGVRPRSGWWWPDLEQATALVRQLARAGPPTPAARVEAVDGVGSVSLEHCSRRVLASLLAMSDPLPPRREAARDALKTLLEQDPAGWRKPHPSAVRQLHDR